MSKPKGIKAAQREATTRLNRDAALCLGFATLGVLQAAQNHPQLATGFGVAAILSGVGTLMSKRGTGPHP